MQKTLTSEGHRALVELIVRKRKEAGLKQEDLARALGETQPWVAHLESYQRRIDVLEFCTLAKLIGFDAIVELQYLLERADMILVDA